MENWMGFVALVYITGFWAMFLYEAKRANYSFASLEDLAGPVFGWFLVVPARGIRLAWQRWHHQ